MASNRIKGITIEIGGNTTKLDKALEGVDDQLKKTQGGLKEVERLLKMDPRNTELLAQKQKLLAEALEQSKKRAETLKEAMSHANEELQRDIAFKEKYAPLLKSLDEAASAYEKLKNKKADMDKQMELGEITTDQYDKWNAKMEESRATLKNLRKQVADAKAEMGGPMIDQDQFDTLQREFIESEQVVERTGKALKKFGTVELQEFNASMDKISDKAGKVSNAFAPISKAVLGIGTAAVATVPATEEFRADLSMLENNARMAGVGLDATRNAFEQFAIVSDEVDSSVEATSNLLQAGYTESNLQRAVENLAGAYLSFPDTLKIESLADSLQETLATGTATGQFAEALDRLGIGAENFSEQMKLIPDEVDRQNFALGTLASKGMADVYKGWVENNQALVENREATLDFQQSMAELAELIQPFLTTLTDMASTFMDWFTGLPEGAQAAVVGIGALVAVISPVAGLISAITGALAAAGVAGNVFSIAGIGVSATLGQWVIIIGIVIVAVLALAAAIAFLTGRSKELDNMKMPDVPDYSSSIPSGGGRPRSMSTVTAQDLPYLAQGAVTRPNSPFLAVVGDNPNEPEIVSPLSTIEQAVRNVMGTFGQAGNIRVTVHFTGSAAQLVRMLQPQIVAETNRLGPQFVN